MILLDTCTIVWDALDPDQLSELAKKSINEADELNTLAISDISIWEVSMLIKKETSRNWSKPCTIHEFIPSI